MHQSIELQTSSNLSQPQCDVDMHAILSGISCCTEWPQPNNPSDVQPNVVSVRLPSNQPPTVLYDIVDSDTGRIIGTYPSNSPRDQRLPVRPSQVYRYGIRARDPNSGRTSPITSELRFLTPPG